MYRADVWGSYHRKLYSPGHGPWAMPIQRHNGRVLDGSGYMPPLDVWAHVRLLQFVRQLPINWISQQFTSYYYIILSQEMELSLALVTHARYIGLSSLSHSDYELWPCWPLSICSWTSGLDRLRGTSRWLGSSQLSIRNRRWRRRSFISSSDDGGLNTLTNHKQTK